MPEHEEQFEQAMSVLTNALQVAAPLATQLRRDLGERAQDALTLEAAIDRAVRAARELWPDAREKGGV